MNGSVTVEPGFEVTGSVVAVGGTLQVAKGARVGGSRVRISDAIYIEDEDGERIDVALTINGRSLGDAILEKILAEVKNCQLSRGSKR